MPKTVTIDWNQIDRANPVLLVVESDRTATLQYKRSSTPIVGNDPVDRTERARRQIAEWSANSGGRPLSVVLYDITKDTPTALLLVCTDEADFLKDVQATEEMRQKVAADFKVWQKNREKRQPAVKHTARRAADSPADVKTDPTPVVPTPEPPQEKPATAPEPPAQPPVVSAPTPMASAPPETLSGFDGMERLLDRGKRSTDARLGWRGYLNRRFGMHLEPDEAEKELRDNVAVIARGWYGSKVVSVANDKGGAGKTPTALMLSAVMARTVPLLVAMFDNNESAGMAKDRVDVKGDHQFTAKHLAQNAATDPYMSPSRMVDFTHRHADDRYHLLASHHPTLVNAAMTRDEVTEVYRALAKVYSLIVTDSGNTIVADNWLTMIQHTDQLVVPVVTASDRYERARAMLATLEGFGGKYADLARNAVVVISVWRAEDKKVGEEYAELFKGRVREVVVIPYDDHLGSNDLRFDSLAPATQAAYTRLAAAVARGLQGADES